MCTGITTTERSLKSKYQRTKIFLTLEESHPKKIDSINNFLLFTERILYFHHYQHLEQKHPHFENSSA